MLGVIYTKGHLYWMSLMLNVIYTECHLYWVSFILSVTNKPFMLNVIMLSVMPPYSDLALFYA
jgi:hypothetical protein